MAKKKQVVEKLPKSKTKSTAKSTTSAKSKTKSASAKSSKPAASSAEWTVMVYMAGDNDLDSFGLEDIHEIKSVGSSDAINILVQRDSASGGGSQRYLLRHGTTVEEDRLADLGRTNTGDPTVLEDFLLWGMQNYPAKRTMAVLWNHGSGWDDTDVYASARDRGLSPRPAPVASPTRSIRGLRTDGTSTVRRDSPTFQIKRNVKRKHSSFFLTAYQVDENRRAIAFDDDAQDFLDSVEMKRVFESASKTMKRKFEVIGMDACLMAMVEVARQVQSAGNYFCASQEVEPGEGWPYRRILTQLSRKPSMDGAELTGIIVKEFVNFYPSTLPVTQSALSLERLTAVEDAVDKLGKFLSSALGKSESVTALGAIEAARRAAQTYEDMDYIDLFDFTTLLAKAWPKSANLCKAVQMAIQACVHANHAPHADIQRSHGLSIYLPGSNYNPLYEKLDFFASGWGMLLAKLSNN